MVLANGALTCYNAKEERGGEARDQLVLTQETQVVEMKVKGACVRICVCGCGCVWAVVGGCEGGDVVGGLDWGEGGRGGGNIHV